MDYRLAKPEWKDLKDPPKYNQWKCSGCRILFWDAILNRKFLEGLHWLHWKTSFLVLFEPAVNCSLIAPTLCLWTFALVQKFCRLDCGGCKRHGTQKKAAVFVGWLGWFVSNVTKSSAGTGAPKKPGLGVHLPFLGHVLNKSHRSHEGARM